MQVFNAVNDKNVDKKPMRLSLINATIKLIACKKNDDCNALDEQDSRLLIYSGAPYSAIGVVEFASMFCGLLPPLDALRDDLPPHNTNHRFLAI